MPAPRAANAPSIEPVQAVESPRPGADQTRPSVTNSTPGVIPDRVHRSWSITVRPGTYRYEIQRSGTVTGVTGDQEQLEELSSHSDGDRDLERFSSGRRSGHSHSGPIAEADERINSA